jgi:hypothetical protein
LRYEAAIVLYQGSPPIDVGSSTIVDAHMVRGLIMKDYKTESFSIEEYETRNLCSFILPCMIDLQEAERAMLEPTLMSRIFSSLRISKSRAL